MYHIHIYIICSLASLKMESYFMTSLNIYLRFLSQSLKMDSSKPKHVATFC
jgi:hypothetical protein